MFGIESLDQVPQELTKVYAARLQAGRLPEGHHQLRGPVGLFLVREDGAGGSKLADEVVGSFRYWHERSKHYFDGVFLGWGFDAGIPVFMPGAFITCVEQLESRLNWESKGGADLLLTDFLFDTQTCHGELDFSRTIPLDISALLKEEKLNQLSSLIEELIAPVRRDQVGAAETSVWNISDHIAILRARQLFWKTLVEKMGTLLGFVDAIAPYAVRDLRRNEERRTAMRATRRI